MGISGLFRKKKFFILATLPKILVFAAAAALFVYTFLRAYTLSMTHDESGSFYIWTHFNIFSCFLDPGCWRTANLHFLYVLFMKGTVGLFGVSELSIRMPSLIGHLIYMYFSWQLVRMWTDREWLVLCGFLVININPFLLEFFALARGYGLANTFVMVAIFYLGLFLNTKSKKAAWGMFIGAFLAVLSNFAMLNFYTCMIAVVGMVYLYLYFNKKIKDSNSWQSLLLIGGLVSVFLFALLYMPITSLSKYGEFEYGAKSFLDTFHSIVKKSLYNVNYMDSHYVETIGGIFVLMLSIGLLLTIKNFIKKPNNPKAQFAFAASFIPVLIAVATVVQHYLLGVNYLRGRTALVFVPLTTIGLFMFLEIISQKEKGWWRKTIPLIIGLFCTVHSFRSYQLTYSYEWWYDSRTKDMVEYMDSIIPEGEKIKLGMHWIFHPTSRFYYINNSYDFTETLNYEKQYRTDDYYDYYYINPGEEKKINPRYKVAKRFPYVGVLMVRDSL